jgi:glycosyltransferase involved in cell wall biosynthesis
MLGLGAPSARVRVIGNGIDPKRFHPIETTDARRELGLPVSGEIVVSVGALVPRKGFHFLVPAIAQIAPRFPNVRLYILGEGDYRSQLEALIPQHRVQDHVILVGAVPNEQLRFWFGAANVSCLASSREGWANVLQESLACGTPVVATRVWGAPEVISSPGLGLLVEQNTRDIASALELALTTKWDREAIAKHAAQRTWASVANEVEEFLFSIIQSRAASGRSG